MKNLISKILYSNYIIKKKKKLRNNDIAFLHIGKTGGTQIMNVFSKLNNFNFKVCKFSHDINLSDISTKNDYFFSIRKPETRFLSAFYSRLRKGQPRIYSEWSEVEEFSFNNFKSANELAEAIYLENEKGKKARIAITGISHMKKNQADWFDNFYFLSIRPPLFIIRKEYLISDMNTLFKILNINLNVKDLIDDNPITSHKNDYLNIDPLSKIAIQNLHRWYSKDKFFYKICSNWLNNNFFKVK